MKKTLLWMALLPAVALMNVDFQPAALPEGGGWTVGIGMDAHAKSKKERQERRFKRRAARQESRAARQAAKGNWDKADKFHKRARMNRYKKDYGREEGAKRFYEEEKAAAEKKEQQQQQQNQNQNQNTYNPYR